MMRTLLHILALSAAVTSVAAGPATTRTATRPATAPSTKPAAVRPTTKPATRPAIKPAPALPPKAIAASPELWEQIAQRKDPPLRQASLARAATMLSGIDEKDQLTALRALTQTANVKFDHAAFKPLVRDRLRSPNAEVRAAAIAALGTCEPNQEDLDPIALLVSDPSPRVRGAVVAGLLAANARVESAQLDTALLALLSDADPNVCREAMRSIGNVGLNEAIDARLIELSRDPKFAHDAIYSGLATRPYLRLPIVERLIEILNDPALAGEAYRVTAVLRNEMDPDARPEVDETLLRVLDDSLDTNVRVNCIGALAASRDPEVQQRLVAMAEDTGEEDRIRDAATRAVRDGR